MLSLPSARLTSATLRASTQQLPGRDLEARRIEAERAFGDVARQDRAVALPLVMDDRQRLGVYDEVVMTLGRLK